MNVRIFALGFAFAALTSMAAAQPSSVVQKTYPIVQGKTYKFERVADGVYYATGGFGSNNVVVVNDADVLIVDTGTSPTTARAFVEDIKLITPKPVKYVVNTHFHFDHTDGNQIFGPDVQIIGHEFVKSEMMRGNVLDREPYKSSAGDAYPARIANLKTQIAAERDATKKAALTRDLATAEGIQAQLREIKVTPPTVTYRGKHVIQAGSQEIQLLNWGLAHTGGDTVVFLPREKIVATGDLMESRLAYMGDATFDDWIAALDALKKLDFTLILPGHGVPFEDKALITAYQDYLQDVIVKGNQLKRGGVSAEDAAKQIDLTSHSKAFPQITGPGAELRGMRRLYVWLTERGGG